MKELSLEKMANVHGGDTAGVLCDVAFAQLAFWNGLAFGLAGATLGVSLAVGAAISVVGIVACEYATG
jgi:hypothetical protein